MNFTRWARHWTPLFGLVGVLGASLSGCGGGSSASSVVDNPPASPGGAGRTPPPQGVAGGFGRATCEAAPRQSGRARWTVLVFLNAANDLQPNSLLNIAQMMNVGSDENLNIVVQWKQANVAGTRPPFVGTRRYYIRKHSAAEVNEVCDENVSRAANCKGNISVLAADRLPDPETNNPSTGQSDMGDWRTLRSFIQWGATTYPADQLAVVIWNHGSGWRSTRAVSQDEQTRNEIDTWELPQALATPPQPIDLLVFDASLMQMTEVAYEVRNSARVMVGSEDSPPGPGYPYHLWLPSMKTSGATRCTVGQSLVDNHISYYTNNRPQDDDGNIVNSMVDLSLMENVGQKLNAFANAMRNSLGEGATIANARDTAQAYAYPENKDLYHYVDLLVGNITRNEVRTTGADLQNALVGQGGGAVMYFRRGASGQDNSSGLAIYVPRASALLTNYNELALARAYPAWANFLREQPQ